jgi:hypothetical protein
LYLGVLEEKKDGNEEGTGDSSTNVMNRLLGQRPAISKKRGITEVAAGRTGMSADEGESSSEDPESSFDEDDSSASSDVEQSD